jgi:glucosamine--fructose-6-phosphate aminotransferase (isomerizing)
MCGIIGFVGGRPAQDVLLEGLRRLEYRGYDSAGMATLEGGMGIQVSRRVGPVRELEKAVQEPLDGSTGIAHTRWATHGKVTEANAHPHLDSLGRIAVVHNGIVENMIPLRQRLEEEGVEFRSETDSEVLAHLISRFYYSGSSPADSMTPETEGDPVEAVRAALKRVRGTWGIAVVFVDHPDTIIAARNGSPLVVGLSDGETFLASDSHALVPFTRRVVFLNDGEIARIDRNGVQTLRLDGGSSSPDIQTLDELWGDGEKGDFPHFMLKEIHEQPVALRNCITGRVVPEEGTARLGGLGLNPRELVDIQRVGLIGCGTAFHACQVGAIAVQQLARVPATAWIASEFRHCNPCIDPRSLYFAVSQSGETADTLGAVREVQLKGGLVRGVVNVVGSTIARTCGSGTYLHSGPEMAVASTKAFSNMVAALFLFALQIGRTRSQSLHQGRHFAEQLLEIPSLVERYLKAPGQIDELVRWVSEAKMVLFLGRGVSSAVASEGALKLMEVAYIPCLAYPSGEMKHGPIALLEPGSPVIVIAPNDSLKQKTVSNLQECRARGARIALIHTEGDDIARHADVSIPVPATSDLFTPLLTVLPLQLLAYQAGLAMGRNVDRPRNLAKSVTVE